MNPEKPWAELTIDEKREKRFERWLSPPGVKFISQEAEERYRARVTRFIKAIKLEEPDRVPVMFPTANFPAYYAGYDFKTVMYDYKALKRAWMKFLNDFSDIDHFIGPGLVQPAKALEIIGYESYRWPGHGLPDEIDIIQYLEKEYINSDEYYKLINDPTDFWLRTFMPRQAKAFRPLAKLPHLTHYIDIPINYLSHLGDPEIKTALKAMMDAGDEIHKWLRVVREVSQTALEAGFPSLFGGGPSGAPFDAIADTCRGTKGIIMDMYRQPDKLNEAMERIAAVMIDDGISSVNASICPVIMMPLHKGNKTFMSQKQFETFYWPTFKKLLLGLINEGIIPMPFAEGNYEPRLETIKDMPRASMIWYFEHMNMARAKEILGDTACIAGNIPVNVLCNGTPSEVKEHCRQLIKSCAKGGGYILSGSAWVNKGKAENLRAILEANREYGVYPIRV